ncbi:hypothetical protein DMENIID0001_157450 [Sergentomyia squamirostris]
MRIRLILLGIFLKCCLISCANILVLEGLPSPSHHVLFRVVNEALAARGHNVTSISADIEKNPVENLTYHHLDRVYEKLHAGLDVNLIEVGKTNPWITVGLLTNFVLATLDGVQISSGYQALLAYPDDFKFDLVIYDHIATPFLLAFLHKFKNPPLIVLTGYNAIGTTSVVLGSPFHPEFSPHHTRQETKNNFLNRVQNYLLYWGEHAIRRYIGIPYIERKLSKDFPGLPSLSDLEEQTRLALINYHPVFDPSEPMLPGLIGVAGLQIKDPKPLPKDLLEVVDKSPFVFFSLGTNVHSDMLGQESIENIVKDTLPVDLPPNLVVRSWFPQSDLLAHPNVKLFISHCGLLSTHEATWRGVPILGVPIFLDQFMNSINNVKSGMGLEYDIRTVTKETFKAAILEVATNPKYKNNAMIRSELFRDQQEKPLDRALWWIEYILRYPDNDILRPDNVKTNIFQKHSVDIVVFLFAVLLLTMYLNWKIALFLFRKIRSRQQRKNKSD